MPELSGGKSLGKGLPAAPKPKEEHEIGKETEKTLGRVFTPGARIDAADEDPQVENAEVAMKEN